MMDERRADRRVGKWVTKKVEWMADMLVDTMVVKKASKKVDH